MATSPRSLKCLRLRCPRFAPLPLVWRTARHLSGSGAGKTVNLRFGGARFTENERMNNAVLLSSCSFIFQEPMAQHVAEHTAQNTL